MPYIKMHSELNELNALVVGNSMYKESTVTVIEGRNKTTEIPTVEYPEGWLRRRQQTTKMIFLNRALTGLECTMTYVTLWWYVNNQIITANIPLSYGLIASG